MPAQVSIGLAISPYMMHESHRHKSATYMQKIYRGFLARKWHGIMEAMFMLPGQVLPPDQHTSRVFCMSWNANCEFRGGGHSSGSRPLSRSTASGSSGCCRSATPCTPLRPPSSLLAPAPLPLLLLAAAAAATAAATAAVLT